ncbi:MAG: hypothetical protein P8183_00355 [Anaerolineae bacterium]
MFSFITPVLAHAGRETIIPIPNHKQWLHFPILIYGLMGWMFGELATVNELNHQGLKNGHGLFLTWAILWTVGGVLALLDLLWQLVGRQDLVVDPTFLTYRRSLWVLGWTKRYELTRIHNIRLLPRSQMGRRISTLVFDYAGQTIQFGQITDPFKME